jgi:aspartyl-tRNA synthetase
VSEALRTRYAAEIANTSAGTEVVLGGWVSRSRDMGGVIFFDLRDPSGLVQVVLDPESIPVGAELKMEYCVKVTGLVQMRPVGTQNPDLETGLVEVAAANVEVLSESKTLPFMIDDRLNVDEFIRLKYRYLDLRRPTMAANLKARAKATAAMRRALDDMSFMEVETPTLIASTPEGARDMLAPSRLQRGSFYALPQSPQIFKQLLMIGGVDRYFQFARCYRDEDFRSDRQLEFTQLDIEGSFWDEDSVMATIETAVASAVGAVKTAAPSLPFERMTWTEAMERFGSDKPDLRFEMEISDISSIFAETDFNGFSGAIADGGSVRGINVGPRDFSRSALDKLIDQAKGLGAKGLVWAFCEDGGWRSPVGKFLSDAEKVAVLEKFGAVEGDLLLIVAGPTRNSLEVLGQLRVDLGQPSGHDELRFVWVTRFPVFDVHEDGSLSPAHHPFTQPESIDQMIDDPENAFARAYDLVLNGSELGSGSVRIHDPKVQEQVFDTLGISPEERESRFGWFLEALRYGTPPHAGFAVGVDRLLAILVGASSIRDVIPFPKTQRGLDPLSGSPSLVTDTQLQELGLDLRPEVRAALAQDDDNAGD